MFNVWTDQGADGGAFEGTDGGTNTLSIVPANTRSDWSTHPFAARTHASPQWCANARTLGWTIDGTFGGTNARSHAKAYGGADAMLYVWPHEGPHAVHNVWSDQRTHTMYNVWPNKRTFGRTDAGSDGWSFEWPYQRGDARTVLGAIERANSAASRSFSCSLDWSDERAIGRSFKRAYDWAIEGTYESRLFGPDVRAHEGSDRQARVRA